MNSKEYFRSLPPRQARWEFRKLIWRQRLHRWKWQRYYYAYASRTGGLLHYTYPLAPQALLFAFSSRWRRWRWYRKTYGIRGVIVNVQEAIQRFGLDEVHAAQRQCRGP